MIPNECASNDSPWLICKPCVSDGKCKIADQLRAAQVAILREAAEQVAHVYGEGEPIRFMLLRMADGLDESCP